MLKTVLGLVGYYWNMPFRELVHTYFFIKFAGVAVIVGLFLIARTCRKSILNFK